MKKNKENIWFTFDNPYWSDRMKADFLQRKIIVASIMYYELNESAISDYVYEIISRQYLDLINNMSIDEKEKTQYWYCFQNYDGSTGFDLFDKLNEKDKNYLMQIAKIVKSH